jgi:membrane-bound lytic murein transglycosylase
LGIGQRYLSTAKYRKHRATGQAVVSIAGQDRYLGPHGTKASRLEYDRLIGEWLASGRPGNAATSSDLTVAELILAYKRFAERYYRKSGKITNEATAILSLANIVRQFYANEAADAFGPLKLQAIQQAMVQAGRTRKHINKQTSRVVIMCSWGCDGGRPTG